MAEDFDQAAIDYHMYPTPGKLAITATKRLTNQRDLALAYSPGVAAACRLILERESAAAEVTSRGNLVGVVSNGTAVLGLGNIGPLASKPVMEGKAVLFKKFANIDVFDIEVDAADPQKMIDVVAALEPTFGGINLEDIKAPDCFVVEETLKERMNIPVFHDDQHGTAICVGAAVTNGLTVAKKKIEKVKLVCSGAGAAAIACLDLLVSLGMKRENIFVCDIEGVLHKDRADSLHPKQSIYCRDTDARHLNDVIDGADIFMGLSAPGVLSPEAVGKMADRPLILALANPTPEILPEEVYAVRQDAIMATGRSDYPNQVNNVLCFPFIFRGALDCGASAINEEMKIACVNAIAALARMEASAEVAKAYGGVGSLQFGAEYIIPKPFDPRLILHVAPAVAEAAAKSGVARRPIEDINAYRESLGQFVYRSGMVMKPVFDRARAEPKRLVFAEGTDERVLQAAQILIDDGIAHPILVGRLDIIKKRIEHLGLRLVPGENIEVHDTSSDEKLDEFAEEYFRIMGRRGVTPADARSIVRTRNTVVASLMVHLGYADTLIAGSTGRHHMRMKDVQSIIGLRDNVSCAAALQLMILPSGTYFMADTHVVENPTAEELVDITKMAAGVVRQFGMHPKVALLSHSNFGSRNDETSARVRQAVRMLEEDGTDLEFDGEMHAAAALNEDYRLRVFPDSRLKGEANLLVMPNLDAGYTAYSLLRELSDGLTVGPMIMGLRKSANVVNNSITVRGLVNVAAVSVVGAQNLEAAG